LPDRRPPRSPVELALRISLLAVVLGVFLSSGLSDTDWEILQTKHYWAADTWYYGGYASQYFATPKGYRTVITEALSNYTNLAALQEQLPAGEARHPVQGFPGTERLATPFLAAALLHVTGNRATVWGVIWLSNVLLWILSIFLAHRIAALAFADRCAPWFAAILVALYPALTVTFNAVKQQPLGTVFLLLGIYLFEARLRGAAAPFRVVALTALMFFGQFADGGWFFLAAYIFLRSWWIPGRAKWASMACLAAALGASGAWMAWLARAYHLPSAAHALGFSYARVLGESWTCLRAWVSGQDVSGLWFLNYPGLTFFTRLWPLVGAGFLSVHAPLVILAVAGIFLEPRSRMFAFLAVPMLLVGHSGVMLSSWYFYYGYLSFPAAVMLILAVSGTLGSLASRRGTLPRVAALALAACACSGFTGQKRQAGIYYGQGPGYFMRHVEIHYGDETGHVDY
jgi:hypothetical protein